MDGAPHRRFARAQPTSPPVAQARAKACTALRVALQSAQLLRWTPSITWNQGVSFHTSYWLARKAGFRTTIGKSVCELSKYEELLVKYDQMLIRV